MLRNKINLLDINNRNFYNIIKVLISNNKNYNNTNAENYIKNIIYNINKYKEKALIFYIDKFEKFYPKNFENLIIRNDILEKAYNNIDEKTKFILKFSKNRIEKFHKEQEKNINKNWKNIEESGNILGQKRNKINSLGFYIPGGTAVYPSTVFMNIIPAKIAGVLKFSICFPQKKNNDLIYAALYLCGIKKVYSFGGIQAIISMAYGNKLIKKVDKISGPGNIYVTLTKKYIYGSAGIDMLAGPSEITVISDCNSNLLKTTFDLFSQSEHDKLSQSVLLCNSLIYIKKIENLIKNCIPFLYRKNVLYNSIINNIILIKTNNLNEIFNILNYISPEHLILSFKKNSYEFFKNIENVGSVFIDSWTNESFGDYSSGLNHIIPTNRNSRYCSPLGTSDFFKNINFLKMNKLSFLKLLKITESFAKKEKLYSHSETLRFFNLNKC